MSVEDNDVTEKQKAFLKMFGTSAGAYEGSAPRKKPVPGCCGRRCGSTWTLAASRWDPVVKVWPSAYAAGMIEAGARGPGPQPRSVGGD